MKTHLILTLFQNLCSGLRLVHIFNHGVHGFLFLHVLVKKHMKTKLILTILNLHLFSYLGFPKIFKMEMSHVCGGNAEPRPFCFTSAAVLIIFFHVFIRVHLSTAKCLPKSTNQTQIFATYCKTPAALTISTKHIKFPRLYSFSCCYLFDVFSKCACSPHAVKNSIISKKHQKCECAQNQ